MKFFKEKLTRRNLDEFISRHGSAGRVLDVGCGSAASYAPHFPSRVCLDAAPGIGVDIVGDAHALPFPDNSFDLVLCIEVLEHLKSPERAIAEMKRVLRPGGKLILTTRFLYPIHDAPGDFWRFTEYGLRYLLREWRIVECFPETDTLGALSVIFQRIAFQTSSPNRLFKLVWAMLGFLLPKLSFLIRDEFGNIKKNIKIDRLMSSGYYFVCEKEKARVAP
ncbi:class I SAM-dependent methyltransferase [Candidatus Uhrbacteria bacterium]|nr:class I SAM-dependent methyltransferase [Candidatus Uhrbacteria bacterium]